MKWSKSITLDQPIQDVRLLTQAPTQNWEEHLRERENAAYEEGRRDGERQAAEQLSQERKATAESQKGVVNSIRELLPKLAQEMESALIQLALESAQKIVGGLPITVKTVENVVREALAQVQQTSEVSIQLHPEDLALLRKQNSPLLEGLPETGPLRFTGSSDVTRGGCVIHTRFGIVDALRETKFEQLRKTVGV